MAREEWKSIAEGLEISSLGNVKAFDAIHGWRGPFQPTPAKNGYASFTHNKTRYYLAREVALAFLGSPPDDSFTVDHINCVRNDNRACNLRWATRSEQRLNQIGRNSRNAQTPDANQDILPGERWIRVGRYNVSNMGRAEVMYPHGNCWGPVFTPKPSAKNTYAQIGRGKAFHRVVALAFLGPPPNDAYTVDHIDCDPTNNKLENLRWASKSEQSRNRKLRTDSHKHLCQRVMICDTNTWIEFVSFSAAARHLQSKFDKKFSSAGVGLAAKRAGTYHGVRMRLAGS